MSQKEEGRTAGVDSILALEGKNISGQIGDEAENNINSLLRNLSGRSTDEAQKVYQETLFEVRRK